MLSPSEYDRLCDSLTTLYDDLDNAIIEDITRRILKTGKVTETAKWQAKQLQESGMLYDDILSEIAKRTDATAQHVKALFEDAGVQSVRNDNRRYRAAGLEGIVKMSDAALQTLYAGYLKCNGDLRNLTLTTALATQTAYINACNSAYMQITSGAFSYQQAIRQAIQRAARDGAFVQYPSGHRDRLDVAVRRAVLTGVGQTVRQISLINANDMGCDLMEITAHSGARPSHAKWQGKIVSLSGKKGYLSKKDIGYGTGDGFGGWNCRHYWFPFFEGISEPAYTPKQLEELDRKNIEYNGKMYSEYEISQIQRKMEREIRAAKREQLAFETAVDESGDSETRQAMQDSLNYSKSLVRDRQAEMRDFINQTGQNRDYFREQNYPKESRRKDLTSNKTRGIINGRSSGKNDRIISNNHTFEKIGNIDFNDLKLINKLLHEFEMKYKDSNIEHCIVFAKNGNVYEVHGDSYRVNTSLLGSENMGSINEHNHVTGESEYSFSWEDLESCADDGTKMAIAFDEKYRYYMVFPDKKLSEKEVYNVYQKAKQSVNDDMIFYPEQITIGDEQHERIKRACEELRIKYFRQEISR